MKRILTLLLALCLLAHALPALAENAGAQPEPLSENTVLSVDLDGDGTEETVSWAMQPGEYDTMLVLTVEPSGGAPITYWTDLLYGNVYIQDLDGDGCAEILLSGDVMSDDYYTWCLQYQDGALCEVLFPDSNRGQSGDGYFKYGYGEITNLTEYGVVDLTGSQDVLGTWMATRRVRLDSPGRFEFCDNGLWERPAAAFDDEAHLWEYYALTVKSPIAYVGDHGCDSGILNPGEKILVYATDKESEALFLTEDDVTGILSISRNYDKGWGWLVDGVPEEDCFETLFYAD